MADEWKIPLPYGIAAVTGCFDGENMDGSLKYSDVVLEHARNPRNAGDLEDTAAVAQVGDPETGDVLRIGMRIEGGIVVEARFKAFGCTAAIAAGSMATTLLAGLSVEAAGRLTNQDVVRALGGLPAEKVRCSVLAEQAIREALRRHHARPSQNERKEAVRCRS